MCENNLLQMSIFEVVKGKGKRVRNKTPDYNKRERLKESLPAGELEQNLKLRELYRQLANYCPLPLRFGGEIEPKVEVSEMITLWCTEYSEEDEHAIKQEPSIYYEAEINDTWNFSLEDKINLHITALNALRGGISFGEVDKMLKPMVEELKGEKAKISPIFKGLQ